MGETTSQTSLVGETFALYVLRSLGYDVFLPPPGRKAHDFRVIVSPTRVVDVQVKTASVGRRKAGGWRLRYSDESDPNLFYVLLTLGDNGRVDDEFVVPSTWLTPAAKAMNDAYFSSHPNSKRRDDVIVNTHYPSSWRPAVFEDGWVEQWRGRWNLLTETS